VLSGGARTLASMRWYAGYGRVVTPAAVLLALVSAAAFVARAPSARAEEPCTPEHTITASSFDYAVCGVPDIDQNHQRWKPGEKPPKDPGLPGEGDSFCAPTATMDAFAYFASHGMPWLRPGTGDWEEPANYNVMRNDLLKLGEAMGTTAEGGTTGTGTISGIYKWSAMRQPGVPGYLGSLVTVITPVAGVFAPTLQEMAEAGAAGDIVIPNIKFLKYETPPAPLSGPPQWYVIGGHFVTLSSALSPDTIGLHDPATQQGETPIHPHHFQSVYDQNSYTLTPVTATFGYENEEAKTDESFEATLLRIDDYQVDSIFPEGTQAFIWGSVIVEPERVTSWTPGGSRIGVTPLLRKAPVRSYTAADGGSVVDLVLDPAGATDLYATEGSQEIWALDTASGASRPFVTTAGQPQLLGVAGRTQTLFVAEAGGLSAYDARGGEIASAAISEPIEALVVDQATGELDTLSAQGGLLRILGPRLRPLGTVQLPPDALAGSGAVSLALRGNVLYAHRDGEPMIALLTLPATHAVAAAPTAVRYVQLADGTGSSGLAVDDRGRIFVQGANGKLDEYGPAGKLLSKSPFSGRSAGSQLAVNASYDLLGPSSKNRIDTPLP
jgi:hypothetical protein